MKRQPKALKSILSNEMHTDYTCIYHTQTCAIRYWTSYDLLFDMNCANAIGVRNMNKHPVEQRRSAR